MEINRGFVSRTIILIVLVFLLDLSYFVESKPAVSRQYGSSLYEVENENQFADYERPEFQQGPRRRRYAFPIDVQDTRCPPGQKLHSSRIRCVPLDTGEDDY